MSELHEGIKAEIAFWQDLIIESRSSIHSIECKRMEHALLFAQMKLLKYEYQHAQPANEPPTHPAPENFRSLKPLPGKHGVKKVDSE